MSKSFSNRAHHRGKFSSIRSGGAAEPIPDRASDAVFDTAPRRQRASAKKSFAAEKSVHRFTYIALFLFTFTVYFRPYDLIPALSGFKSMALVFAIAAVLLYLPTQLNAEGALINMTTEVKCILFISVWALLTIPIAKSPTAAWQMFSEVYIKIVVIFVVMAGILRTRSRIMGLIWLALAVGLMLSYQALDLYQRGVFNTEGYRVSVEFGGMFGNANDMAIHFVVFTPIAIVLGASARSLAAKIFYFGTAGVMIVAAMLTQSRGGFLGLVMVAAVLIWKLGKANRLKVFFVSAIFIGCFLAFAPGNYGGRLMSIIDPSLDSVGSAGQRRELLMSSIVTTLRNPLGIGMGNSPIIGTRNLATHNAYTQVSSELGWLCFGVYLVLLIYPIRSLSKIEKALHEKKDRNWIFYLSVGLQAGMLGYMVSSFFASVAYDWYIFYPIAFAIGLRALYKIEGPGDEAKPVAA